MKATKVLFLVFLSILSLCVVNTQPVKAAENSWTTKASMPTAISGLGVAVVNGKIYAIGGYNGSYLGINEMYDPATNTWTTKKPMPTPRRGFGIAVYQNKIYVIGGQTSIWEETGVNEVYDPLTDTWETKTPMPTNRCNLHAHVVNNKIYLIGGIRSRSILDVNEVYDPSIDSWTTKTPIPTGVYAYASAVVNNRIYVISGYVDLTQIYDPETDTWSYGAPIPTAVVAAAAGATTGVFAPKRIYVIGGRPTKELDPHNLNQVYDPERDVWTTGATIPTPREDLGVAVVNDVLYAIGGSTGFLRPLTAQNEQYMPFGFGTVLPDTTPPTISIVSPENKTYSVNNVSLTFTVSETTSWIGYSLDGQVNVTIVGNTTLSGLPDGSHSLIVYAKDAAGNIEASEIIYFSIKTKKAEPFPTLTVVAIAIITIGVAIILGVVFYRKRKD